MEDTNEPGEITGRRLRGETSHCLFNIEQTNSHAPGRRGHQQNGGSQPLIAIRRDLATELLPRLFSRENEGEMRSRRRSGFHSPGFFAKALPSKKMKEFKTGETIISQGEDC